MSDELSNEEAEALLVKLTKHYRMPVQPIDRYCDALRTWQREMRNRLERKINELYPDTALDFRSEDSEIRRRRSAAYEAYHSDSIDNILDVELADYRQVVDNVNFVFLQITKSALLDRLLYCGESLRTEMCPTHKGRWSGLFGECEHGCQLTGWLPNEKTP